MGAFLDKPLTDKTTTKGEGQGLKYGFSEMQGWRIEMEDAHVHEIGLPGFPKCSFFCVFDGHGGKTAAINGARLIVSHVLQSDCFQKNKLVDPEVVKESLREAFLKLDRELRPLIKMNPRDVSGSTAVGILVTETHYVFANIGDSRALIVRDNKIEFATEDHKPFAHEERTRILQAGGHVTMGRVNGNLAVSRGIGDFEFKQRTDLPEGAQLISPVADVTAIERKDSEDHFLVIACDGIWDVMTNEQVHCFVRYHLNAGVAPEEIAELLLTHCLEADSKDNMTAGIVVLPGCPAKVEDDEDKTLKERLDCLGTASLH